MYQIAICDDEKIFTDKLAHMIKQYSNAHHHVIDLHLFQQAADFIQSSLESYDIVFLDVRFGEISGIEVAKGPRPLMNRNILYTAVTRGKKCVTIVGNKDTVREMIQNKSEQMRYSSLCRRLQELEQESLEK